MPEWLGWSGAVVAVLLSTATASAEDVTVRVENLRNGRGSLLVAICAAEAFLSAHCPHHARARARTGTAEVTIGGVTPGIYAVQVIHDENDNLELDRNLIGLPLEGLGFSRDAPMRMAPPRFLDAAVEIDEGHGSVTLSMRYF